MKEVARAALVLLVACGCHHPAPPEVIATPAPGISLALYQASGKSYTVVDDRRWVEVRGGVLMLDHVDPGAALPSLVIEPLGGDRLAVGQCERGTEAAAVSPVVTCTATGAVGRHLVRLLYVSSSLAYRAQHDLAMTAPDRATVATRFSIAAPAWGGRADITLFEGLPGGDVPAVELARGSLALDGTTAVLGAPPRQVTARLRWIYDGAIRTGVANASDPSWGRDSVHAVWVWLELDRIALSPGLTHAHLELPGEEIRDVDVPATGGETSGTGTRLPLWIDDELRGVRGRTVTSGDGGRSYDRFTISVSNAGATAREVWVEEKLRPAKHRALTGAWPARPVLGDETARIKLTVRPGATERVGYTIAYDF